MSFLPQTFQTGCATKKAPLFPNKNTNNPPPPDRGVRHTRTKPLSKYLHCPPPTPKHTKNPQPNSSRTRTKGQPLEPPPPPPCPKPYSRRRGSYVMQRGFADCTIPQDRSRLFKPRTSFTHRFGFGFGFGSGSGFGPRAYEMARRRRRRRTRTRRRTRRRKNSQIGGPLPERPQTGHPPRPPNLAG